MKKSYNAPMSAHAAAKNNTDVKFNMSPRTSKGHTVGKTDMGIPPFNQKVQNLYKLSNIARNCKKPANGTDKYS